MYKIKRNTDIGDLILNLQDYPQILYAINGNFDPHIRDIINSLVTPEMICIDVGTHIGIFTLQMARICTKVYAFEPFLPTYEHLIKNLHINNITNVIPCLVALSDKNGLSTLKGFNNKNWGATQFNLPIDISCENILETEGGTLFLTRRLDAMNLGKIDFIKIDAENQENNVLLGCEGIMKQYRPYIACGINNKEEYEKAVELCKRTNYTMQMLYKNDKHCCCYIFMHESVHKDVTKLIKIRNVNEINIYPKNAQILLQGNFILSNSNMATEEHLLSLYNKKLSIPVDHYNYLTKLRDEEKFQPKVIYDIGSAVRHWQRLANDVWPDAKVYLFDAYEPYEFLYKNFDYHIGVLSNKEKMVKFYQSSVHVGGNSYYKENDDNVFPESCGVEKMAKTLDSVVEENKFMLPDLVKMDVQGAEIDIFKGGQNVLKHAKYIIMEAQHTDYNRDAPKYNEVIEIMKNNGWECVGYRFCVNGADADYCFRNNNFT